MKEARARGAGSVGDDKSGNVRRIGQVAPTVKIVSVDGIESGLDPAAFAAKLFAALISSFHAHDVDWGPNPHRVHLVICELRERLAQEIRARDAAIRREVIQRIRTRLYE